MLYIQPASQHLTLEQLLSYLVYKFSYFEFSYELSNAGAALVPGVLYFTQRFKLQLSPHMPEFQFDTSLFIFGGACVDVRGHLLSAGSLLSCVDPRGGTLNCQAWQYVLYP